MLGAFRHYSGLAFNVRTPFSMDAFRQHVALLVRGGASEVELSGRVLQHRSQRERMTACVDVIHAEGALAVLYSSALGSDSRAEHRRYAQRSATGEALGYLGSSRALMMCPCSPYVSVAARETGEAVARYGFDKVFIDIPWILRGGCFCTWCTAEREAGVSRDGRIRQGLQTYRTVLHAHAAVPIGANVGAPTIHREAPAPAALEGVVDELVTEWNPFRWGSGVGVVRSILKATPRWPGASLFHATTCTDRQGQPIPREQLVALFAEIWAGGATPRIGVGRPLLPLALAALAEAAAV